MRGRQTVQRRETDRLLSIAIQKKLHPPSDHPLTPSYSPRAGWISSGIGPTHLCGLRKQDKSKISLPRCAGTGNADWKLDDVDQS